MSSRSYLSIGDVLTLLRQEFPDVTISKIRFLESQGLVNPERTPSGYRKFYEHDVERLRWVLRQQRENFLPLKVIKDRLEGDPNGATAGAEEPANVAAPDERATHRVATAPANGPVLVGQRTAAARITPTMLERASGSTDDGATLPGLDPAAPVTGQSTHAAFARSTSAATGVATGGPGPVRRAPAERAETRDAKMTARRRTPTSPDAPNSPGSAEPMRGAPTDGPARDVGRGAVSPPTPAAPVTPTAPTAPPAPAVSAVAAAKRPGAAASHGGAPTAGGGGLAAGPTGASLTADELASAAGLDVTVLRELQEYGLLSASNVGGIECFDEDALTVAQLMGQFARFGIEPRHLRLYKNAADREAGFVEQVVLPLVRQRNPEARARALQTADELARLGQQLRSSLLRTALRSVLNG